jgi:hypothetical protein
MYTVESAAADAGASGCPCRGQEPAGGGTEVWTGAENGPEDAEEFLIARPSKATAGAAAEAGTMAGRNRRDTGRLPDTGPLKQPQVKNRNVLEALARPGSQFIGSIHFGPNQ